jgi:hypothetical protein
MQLIDIAIVMWAMIFLVLLAALYHYFFVKRAHPKPASPPMIWRTARLKARLPTKSARRPKR